MSVNDSSWLVPLDLPAFEGHFPYNPIVPGVVLLDQVLLRIQQSNQFGSMKLSVINTKFLSPVKPGELISFQFNVVGGVTLHFDMYVQERKIATGSIIAADHERKITS